MVSFKQIFEIFTFYLLPIVLITLNILAPKLNLLVLSGSIAEILFIAIMFFKPIAVISNSEKLRNLLPYRKELGITIFWFALFHGVGLIFKYNLMDINRYLTLSSHLLYAALAMIFIIILGITSNNFSMEKLGPNWKRLQYLAYLALLLTILHSSMVTKNMLKFYIIAPLFIVLKGVEWFLESKRDEAPPMLSNPEPQKKI